MSIFTFLSFNLYYGGEMIDFSRVGNNVLTIGVLAAIGYMLYAKFKDPEMKEKIKGFFSRDKMGRGKV